MHQRSQTCTKRQSSSIIRTYDGYGRHRACWRKTQQNEVLWLSEESSDNPRVPSYCHVALVRHHHQLLSHQGRHLTEGAVSWTLDYWREKTSVISDLQLHYLQETERKTCRSINGWSSSRQDRASTTLHKCRCGRLRPLVDRYQKNTWWKRVVKAMGGPIYMLGDKSRPHQDSRFP